MGGSQSMELITRRFNKPYQGGRGCKECPFTHCHGSEICTRLATPDEIAKFQQKCEELDIAPNTFGGYKRRGAKETKNQKRNYSNSTASKTKKKSSKTWRKKKKKKKENDVCLNMKLCSLSP